MNIRKYFSAEQVNHGRQMELDLLKGFAIIFMVWVHVTGQMGNNDLKLPFFIVNDILGCPYAAPMFMMALGVGVCFSQRKSAARLAFRAVSIFMVGLLLNVARYVLPGYLYAQAVGHGYTGEYLFGDLFIGDILQFAAFTFLFFAFARWRKWSLGKLVMVGVSCSLLAWMLRYQSTGNESVDYICSWFWGTGEYTSFPFLGWIIFPIAGVCIGHALLHCRDKNAVYLRVSPICLLIGTAYVWYAFVTRTQYLSDAADYFLLTTVDAFFIILLGIGLLGQNALLLRLCKGWKFPMLTRLSRNINAVYCIHWTLLTFSSLFCRLFLEEYRFGFVTCCIITVVLLVASDALASLYAAKIRPALHASLLATRQHPMWQPVFKFIHTVFPQSVRRGFRALNVILFSGGVSLMPTDKNEK